MSSDDVELALLNFSQLDFIQRMECARFADAFFQFTLNALEARLECLKVLARRALCDLLSGALLGARTNRAQDSDIVCAGRASQLGGKLVYVERLLGRGNARRDCK
ncbi:hypothetical protein [Burkholderia cepacia]|uniref:hypothetical protein n=1 Tax=Burkholderia cepacia TaxID=292 RepID=UPI001FC81C81|nr:hypothetical protein [Burkholderia cepacia]